MKFEVTEMDQLEPFLCKNWGAIVQYLDEKKKNLPLPIYSSVDIREGQKKMAPIDHNIYPAGFNNLCNQDLDACPKNFMDFIFNISRDISHVAIIPESHSKNTFYLDHLHALRGVLEKAGFAVTFITFDEEFMQGSLSQTLLSHSQHPILLRMAAVRGGEIEILSDGGPALKNPDLILLNNDQSFPINVPWNDIKTPIVPSPRMGWNNRQKISHFIQYKKVADEFCQHFNIMPDLIQAKFRFVHDVDFSEKKGMDKLAKEVDLLLRELGPSGKVFVKANQGTYGMGIMVVSSADEILNMNRKTRNKMDVGKNNKKFTSFLIQEAVETVLKYENMAAEVAIYLVGGDSVGGFMRAHPLRTTDSNLNTKGMVFRKFCISEMRKNPQEKSKEALYSIIAQLATLASGLEILDSEK